MPITPALAVSAGALERIVATLRDLEARSGPFTLSEARQALATTRKYAVPLMETLDARGLTIRRGDRRSFR